MHGSIAQEWSRRQFVTRLAAAGVLAGAGIPAFAQSTMSADAAIKELDGGQCRRYVAGQITSFPEDLKILQEKTVLKQEPFAAVLSCADSRVPVEILFDQSIGHVFVSRSGGQCCHARDHWQASSTASPCFGIKGPSLVMGHSNCGAISAAVAAKEVPGQIRPVL